MLRTMMKSKIHRATVTQADLHYVGSVTVDADLLDAADLLRASWSTSSTSPTARGSRPTRSRGPAAAASSGSTGRPPTSCTPATSSSSSPTGRWRPPRPASSSRTWSSSTPRTGWSARAPTRPTRPTAPGCCAATASRAEPAVLLCADIGNSHTTVGLLDGREVVHHWRVATDERRTADEWGVLLRRAPRLDRLRRDAARGRGLQHRPGRAARVAADDGDLLRRRCRTSSSSRACARACRC